MPAVLSGMQSGHVERAASSERRFADWLSRLVLAAHTLP
ncbi:hypothetical protein EDF32_1895 [Cellulomonas sp. PhB143]|nr:hypothetical protein EDF32_1895 [Cellulomonas sp. PhB143]